ncbi:MAG TPA: hypothetical protein PKA64_24120 [Myxococcota bacterium]|nr:hypothetical protein [Myxococcota bacterium]
MIPGLLLLALAACEPPDAPDLGSSAEPAIELLYPPADVGTIALDLDSVLRILVVADIDNLDYVPDAKGQAAVDGQGHYHVNINGVYVAAPVALYYEYASEPGAFTVGQQLSLSVTLAANDHTALDMYDAWERVIEFEVGRPEIR